MIAFFHYHTDFHLKTEKKYDSVFHKDFRGGVLLLGYRKALLLPFMLHS